MMHLFGRNCFLPEFGELGNLCAAPLCVCSLLECSFVAGSCCSAPCVDITAAVAPTAHVAKTLHHMTYGFLYIILMLQIKIAIQT